MAERRKPTDPIVQARERIRHARHSVKEKYRKRFNKEGERVLWQMARQHPELFSSAWPEFFREATSDWPQEKLERVERILKSKAGKRVRSLARLRQLMRLGRRGG